MIIQSLKAFLRKFDHILLLVSLIFFIATPLWETLIRHFWIWSELSIILIIISGISVTYSHKVLGKRPHVNFYLGFLAIIFTTLDFWVDFENNELLNTIAQSIQVGFFLMLTVLLFALILRARRVDAEVVTNAISGYLLVGISWAIIIALLHTANPEAFDFGGSTGNIFYDEVYFAFVTLTTLGYGDFLPVTPAAKSISMLISITGSFYTTIVLGMIVGKFISNPSNME